jgi:redox-sensitive bicupin YhaK (pirin superfamily)
MTAFAPTGPGDVQWLTAGAGIVHSEMFPLLDRERSNPTELFQIWLNLPARSKLAPPHFSMLWSDAIPRLRIADEAGRETIVTVIAGQLADASAPSPPPDSWASDPASDAAIWTIDMAASARWTLPAARSGTVRTLYVYDGDGIAIGGHDIPGSRAVRLAPEHETTIENATAASSMLLLQGRPIGERVVQHGPFVMNAEAEIHQAIRDYQRTGFGGWPFASEAPVHPREARRFARHADGREERPKE